MAEGKAAWFASRTAVLVALILFVVAFLAPVQSIRANGDTALDGHYWGSNAPDEDAETWFAAEDERGDIGEAQDKLRASTVFAALALAFGIVAWVAWPEPQRKPAAWALAAGGAAIVAFILFLDGFDTYHQLFEVVFGFLGGDVDKIPHVGWFASVAAIVLWGVAGFLHIRDEKPSDEVPPGP